MNKPTGIVPSLLEAKVPAKAAESVAGLSKSQIIPFLDLTTLNGNDTPSVVETLVEKAKQFNVAAVCVYSIFLPQVKQLLAGGSIKSCAVSVAFPHGLSPLESRIAETKWLADQGAQEIDIVIPRYLALDGRFAELYEDVCALREACPNVCLKVILATGELVEPTLMRKAGLVAAMAGADFLKTSTGKETVNATLEAGTALAEAIRIYHEATGVKVGLKAAGGVKTYKQANDWIRLIADELGEAWVNPNLFRLGASSLLDALTC